jgi:hypothetical protein
VPDPDPSKEPQQPDPSEGEQSPEAIVNEFRNGLNEELPTFVVREEERDLATLDDAGIASESRREEVRDFRQRRAISKDVAEDAKKDRKLQRAQRIIFLSLLPFAAVVAFAVVVVGLLKGEDVLVQAGLAALCGICGGALWRLGAGLSKGPSEGDEQAP